VFVVGRRDPFIPPRRSTAFLEAVETHLPEAQVVALNAGHFRTLSGSGRYQLAMLGLQPPSRWRLRMPMDISLPRLGIPRPGSGYGDA
jgi:hypothetical protein